MPELLSTVTVTQAAAELKVSQTQVRRLIKAGLLDATLVNTMLYLVTREELAAYKRRRRGQGRPPGSPNRKK